MSDFLRTTLVLVLTVAPLGALGVFESLTEPPARARIGVACAISAFALLAGTALLADTLLDWLDVSPENFQLAAALIVLPHAFHLVLRGNSMGRSEDYRQMPWLVPLTVPVLVSPASVAATIAYASRYGSGTTIAAAGLVLALTAAILATVLLVGARQTRAIAVINRFAGALLIALALELAVDGIRSV